VTKHRPLFEDVLLKVLGELTPAVCQEITGRTASYLRDASDPDKGQLLSVQDMIRLDTAHIGIDGNAPLTAAVCAILEQARADIYTDAVSIGRATVDVLKEDGEAHVALFLASQPNATDAQLLEARREIEQSSAAQANALAVVCTALQHRGRLPP